MKPRLGVLSMLNSPLLCPVVAALHAHGVFDMVLLLDERGESEKDLGIWQQRTGGYFDLLSSSIYGFEVPPPAYFVRNHNSEICSKLVESLGLTVLLNAGTPRKLKRKMLEATPCGVINVHPGVLPDYRGSSCVEWAIYNDDPVGNSAHFMNEEYDAGPIIAVEPYTFPKSADYKTIRCLTYERGFALMAKSVVNVLNNGLRADQLGQIPPGRLWNPIPPDKMAAVLHKVEAKQYRYMTD